MLFLPRVLGAGVFMRREQQQYGGGWSLLKAPCSKACWPLLQAPVRMLAHSLFVLVALTGIALDWKSPPAKRKPFHGATPWRSWPHDRRDCLAGGGHWRHRQRRPAVAGARGVPLALAIPMAVITSQIALGRSMRAQRFLLIPEEAWSPPCCAGLAPCPKAGAAGAWPGTRSGHGLIQAVSEGKNIRSMRPRFPPVGGFVTNATSLKPVHAPAFLHSAIYLIAYCAYPACLKHLKGL